MGLTDITAIYAALVATVGLGWTIYREVTDRGRLRATLGLDGRDDAGTPIVEMTVINLGRRPIITLAVEVRFVEGSGGVDQELPMATTLAPGERHRRNLVDVYEMANIASLTMVDSTGRRWRVPQSEINRVARRREAQPAISEP